MKQPEYPQQIWEPHKPERKDFRLTKSSEGKIIYRDLDSNDDYDPDLFEEQMEDMFEDEGEERPPLPEQRYWEKLSLQDIVDLAPPGTKLCDIILGISFPRDYSYTDLTFTVYKRDFEAEEKAYQKAFKKYEKDLAEYQAALPEYERKMAAFEDWQKEQKIKRLQEEIDMVKND